MPKKRNPSATGIREGAGVVSEVRSNRNYTAKANSSQELINATGCSCRELLSIDQIAKPQNEWCRPAGFSPPETPFPTCSGRKVQP